MNDHGEKMQAIAGVLIIFGYVVGAMTIFVCIRHFVGALVEWMTKRS